MSQIYLEESASYEIKYNTKKDEYYIKARKYEIPLELGIPDNADKVVMEIFCDGKMAEKREFGPNDYSDKDLVVRKTKTDYLTVEITRNKKSADKIRLIIEK